MMCILETTILKIYTLKVIKSRNGSVTCIITMNDTTPTEEDENAKESVNEQEIEWKERGVRDTFPFHSGKKISFLLKLILILLFLNVVSINT